MGVMAGTRVFFAFLYVLLHAAGRRPGSAARRAGGGWVGDLLHNHGVDGFLEQKMQARRWGVRRSLVISD